MDYCIYEICFGFDIYIGKEENDIDFMYYQVGVLSCISYQMQFVFEMFYQNGYYQWFVGKVEFDRSWYIWKCNGKIIVQDIQEDVYK